MILLKRLFYFSIVLCTIVSCKKKIPDIDYPKEHYCEKFAGKYAMYDPNLDINYEMTIRCILNEDESYDTIQILNYANRFDFKYRPGIVGAPHGKYLDGVILSPLKDHTGNSTHFSMGGYSENPPKNILRNDSIYIEYTINNLAFYITDGVPWEVCYQCLHYGIRIH